MIYSPISLLGRERRWRREWLIADDSVSCQTRAHHGADADGGIARGVCRARGPARRSGAHHPRHRRGTGGGGGAAPASRLRPAGRVALSRLARRARARRVRPELHLLGAGQRTDRPTPRRDRAAGADQHGAHRRRRAHPRRLLGGPPQSAGRPRRHEPQSARHRGAQFLVCHPADSVLFRLSRLAPCRRIRRLGSGRRPGAHLACAAGRVAHPRPGRPFSRASPAPPCSMSRARTSCVPPAPRV